MRIVVDLPAPLLPRKPKISPCSTSNDTRSTATKAPKRRVSSRTVDGWHRPAYLPSARSRRASARRALASARVRSSSAWSSATCASSTSVFVDQARLEALGDDAARLGRRRAPRRARRGSTARAALDVELALPHLEVQHRVELGQALLDGALVRSRLGDVGLHAAAVPERPRDVDADVPGRVPLVGPREDARVRPRVVEPRADGDDGLQASRGRVAPPADGVHAGLKRLALGPMRPGVGQQVLVGRKARRRPFNDSVRS